MPRIDSNFVNPRTQSMEMLEQLTTELNQAIDRYYTNPRALTATAEVLRQKYWSDRDYQKLPYIKGLLVAFLWDLALHGNPRGEQRSLDDFFKHLFRRFDAPRGGYDNEGICRELSQLTGEDWQAFCQHYVLGAERLPLEQHSRRYGVRIELKKGEAFDMGFTVLGKKLHKGAKVSAVASDSNAEKAGLREGDVLLGYSIARGRDKKASLDVRRGQDRLAIRYRPVRTFERPQLVVDDANRERIESLKQY